MGLLEQPLETSHTSFSFLYTGVVASGYLTPHPPKSVKSCLPNPIFLIAEHEGTYIRVLF